MKKVLFLIITSLLVLAPIGSNIDSCFNKIIITYAAKSTNKKSSSTKKKKSTTKKSTKKKDSSTKKKTTGNNKTYNGGTKKSATSKKSTPTYNSNLNNNNSSGSRKVVENDRTICYISGQGECYHKNPKCSNMRSPIETTVGKVGNSLRKCKKCWK